MQNKQKQKQEQIVTKNTLREIGYTHEWAQRLTRTSIDSDRYQQGELLVAANILTGLAAKRATQRDLMDYAKSMLQARDGTYDYNKGSHYQAGLPPMPKEPPANWPLAKDEWPVRGGGEDQLLTKAGSLIVAEMERRNRTQQSIWRYNYSELDDESRELANKRREIASRKGLQGWRNRERRAQNGVDDTPVNVYAGGIQTPATGNAIDFTNIQPQSIRDYEYQQLDAALAADSYSLDDNF